MNKIAFVTAADPLDKRSWSGIYYRMYHALGSEFKEVIPLGPIRFPFIEFVLKVYQFFVLLFTGKRYNRSHSILLSKAFASVLRKKLKKDNFDAVFAPSASTMIASLVTEIPIYYFADATVHLMMDYYKSFSNLSGYSIRESNCIEIKAVSKAKAAIFASTWAAEDAIKTFDADPMKIAVVKMGANIDRNPDNILREEKIMQKVCNLLFLGVDWERKGGEIVFNTFEILLKNGFDAKLVVCGCTPPVTHPLMTVYPFLNKNIESDNRIFETILKDAHFLFLPTRAECAGIVFSEAAAYGIPSITTDTGGVSSYVENAVTGFVLPLSASPSEYAGIIASTFDNKKLYAGLSAKSREKYLEELNWNVWAKNIKEIMIRSAIE